jgi:hypothetical protein
MTNDKMTDDKFRIEPARSIQIEQNAPKTGKHLRVESKQDYLLPTFHFLLFTPALPEGH